MTRRRRLTRAQKVHPFAQIVETGPMIRPEKYYEGPCAGGPHDGKPIVADVPRINVPVIIPGEPGIGQSWYLWNDDVKMWIWQGK